MTCFSMANYGMIFFPFSTCFLVWFLYILFFFRFGRENFQESLKISHRTDSAFIDWSAFKYMVFDAPNHSGTYAERYSYLGNYYFSISILFSFFTNFLLIVVNNLAKNRFIEIAEKRECKGIEDLEKFFQDIIDKGGEGVILRDPSALLQPGRSASYLKHKVFFFFKVR